MTDENNYYRGDHFSNYLDCIRNGYRYHIHKDVCRYRLYYDYPECQVCEVYVRETKQRRQSIADKILR